MVLLKTYSLRRWCCGSVGRQGTGSKEGTDLTKKIVIAVIAAAVLALLLLKLLTE